MLNKIKNSIDIYIMVLYNNHKGGEEMRDKMVKGTDIENAFQEALELDAAFHAEPDRSLAYEYKKKYEGMIRAFRVLGLYPVWERWLDRRDRNR